MSRLMPLDTARKGGQIYLDGQTWKCTTHSKALIDAGRGLVATCCDLEVTL